MSSPFTDTIVKVFPWYMRMHLLMGTSPVINQDAVENSLTLLNLNILACNGKGDEDKEVIGLGALYVSLY